MSFGKFGTDREERINYPRMREYRLARTKAQMEKDGIGCLITWCPYDIRYISGAYVTTSAKWSEGGCVVLPRNGDPHVFAVTSFSPYAMRKDMPWLKDKAWASFTAIGRYVKTLEDVEPAVSTVARIMAEHGISNETVGIDGTTSELLYVNAFEKKGIKAVDAKATMFEARKIKNQDEIECVRMACMNAEAAFSDIKNAIKPGVKECELVGIGMNRLYAEGADEVFEFVCASGPRTNPLYIDFTDRQVRHGDLVIIDINGNSWHGYKSCYYRTFCCGKATQEQKDTYEECRAMLWNGIGAVKAGNTTLDIAEKWPTDPKYWGYDTWEDCFGYAAGHGVGITLHEYPWISYPAAKANPVKLEEGMVIALETWTGKKGGIDGVRLEDKVAITKDGYDLLTKYPVNEITECDI
ncbi:M24 family metallopeptidase [Chloroflexota bacterium]